jgi:DNA-binding ferritin-like protein
MEEKKEIGPLLNELITINKNRITGYKQALHPNTLNDSRSTVLFREMIRQSEEYIDQLEERIKEIGAVIEDKTSTSGLLYNTWMDVLYAESEEAKPDTKSFCIQLEQTTLSAYKAIADKGQEIDKNLSQMIIDQENGIERSLALIKAL